MSWRTEQPSAKGQAVAEKGSLAEATEGEMIGQTMENKKIVSSVSSSDMKGYNEVRDVSSW